MLIGLYSADVINGSGEKRRGGCRRLRRLVEWVGLRNNKLPPLTDEGGERYTQRKEQINEGKEV